MDKNEFLDYMDEKYPLVMKKGFSEQMLRNILRYAEDMGVNEQTEFLLDMIPYVPERVIKGIYY